MHDALTVIWMDCSYAVAHTAELSVYTNLDTTLHWQGWLTLDALADRDDIPSITVERFLPLMLDQEEEGQTLTPCFTHGGINYIYIRYNNLYRTYAGGWPTGIPC